MDSAVGTNMGIREYDDWDDEAYGNCNGDNDISFDPGDDEAIIYHLKLVERKSNGIKKRKIKRIEIETEFPKRPRKLYVAATRAAATQTKRNNGYEDNDDNDNSNSNGSIIVSLSSRERKQIMKSKQQKRWMIMYELLIAYKKEDNTTKVPRNYDKLGVWVALQRKMSYNNSYLKDGTLY